MLVRDVATVDGLLAILEQPTSEMQALREQLTIDGRFPTRRTWERRLKALPGHVPGPHRLSGRLSGDTARSVGWLWAGGGDRQHRAPGAGRGLAQEAPRGRRRPPHVDRHRGPLDQVGLARLGLWLAAAPRHHRRRRLDPARRRADAGRCDRQRGRHACLHELPADVRFILGDTSYHDPRSSRSTVRPPTASWWPPGTAAYPHTDDGVALRRIFHQLRSLAIAHFNEQIQRPLRCARLRPDARPRPHPTLRTRRHPRLPADLAPAPRASATTSTSASKPS